MEPNDGYDYIFQSDSEEESYEDFRERCFSTGSTISSIDSLDNVENIPQWSSKGPHTIVTIGEEKALNSSAVEFVPNSAKNVQNCSGSPNNITDQDFTEMFKFANSMVAQNEMAKKELATANIIIQDLTDKIKNLQIWQTEVHMENGLRALDTCCKHIESDQFKLLIRDKQEQLNTTREELKFFIFAQAKDRIKIDKLEKELLEKRVTKVPGPLKQDHPQPWFLKPQPTRAHRPMDTGPNRLQGSPLHYQGSILNTWTPQPVKDITPHQETTWTLPRDQSIWGTFGPFP